MVGAGGGFPCRPLLSRAQMLTKPHSSTYALREVFLAACEITGKQFTFHNFDVLPANWKSAQTDTHTHPHPPTHTHTHTHTHTLTSMSH